MNKNTLDFIKIRNGYSMTLGANQYWFNQKFAALSGCGPTTASEILAFLSKQFPQSMQGIYPDDINALEREAFVRFMQEVRTLVKPGVMGLTDINFYTEQTIKFAFERGVSLAAKQLDLSLTVSEALQEIADVIDQGRPLALLVLTNPHPDIRDYTWHWMTIIGYNKEEKTILIATHGAPHTLNFDHVWVNEGGHKTGIVHFWPEGVS